MKNKFLALLLLPVLLAGCSSITNLTPSSYPRDASGVYRVEAEWRSDRQVIRGDSFNPVVVMETNSFPLRAVPLVQDRWEGFLPVPAGENLVHYHFKFDFMVNSISQPRPDSLMSQDYPLKIVDAK